MVLHVSGTLGVNQLSFCCFNNSWSCSANPIFTKTNVNSVETQKQMSWHQDVSCCIMASRITLLATELTQDCMIKCYLKKKKSHSSRLRQFSRSVAWTFSNKIRMFSISFLLFMSFYIKCIRKLAKSKLTYSITQTKQPRNYLLFCDSWNRIVLLKATAERTVYRSPLKLHNAVSSI